MNLSKEPQNIPLSRQASEAAPTARQACVFQVGGMDCPSCADSITKALGKLEGIQDVSVDILGGKVRVS